MISMASLQVLRRPGVREVRLASGKRPAAHQDDGLEEIDPALLSTDDIVQFLYNMGGSRYVDTLGPAPSEWRTRAGALGLISVTATLREGEIEVSFSRCDGTPAPAPTAPKPAPPAPPVPEDELPPAPEQVADPPPAAPAPVEPSPAAPPSTAPPPPLPGLAPLSGDLSPRLDPEPEAVEDAPASRDGTALRRRAGQALAVLVAAAVCFAGYLGIGRYRVERALRRASFCVAQGDADCARAAINGARSGGEDDERLRVAEAGAALLDGEPGPAETLLATMPPEDRVYVIAGARRPMTPAEHADLLLLRGDLLIARGQADEARRDLEAARREVSEPALVDLRLQRAGLGRAADDATEALPSPSMDARPVVPLDPGERAELAADCDRVLSLVTRGQTADATPLLASLDARVAALANEAAASRLRPVLDALREALQQAKYNASMDPDQTSKPPKAPTGDDLPRWTPTPDSAERERERVWLRYQADLDRFNALQAPRRRVKEKNEQKLAEKLERARRTKAETFAGLAGGGP
jgi:hypothetical protein